MNTAVYQVEKSANQACDVKFGGKPPARIDGFR